MQKEQVQIHCIMYCLNLTTCRKKNLFLKLFFLNCIFVVRIAKENNEILFQDSKIQPIIQVILHMPFAVETTVLNPLVGETKIL